MAAGLRKSETDGVMQAWAIPVLMARAYPYQQPALSRKHHEVSLIVNEARNPSAAPYFGKYWQNMLISKTLKTEVTEDEYAQRLAT